jgi:hypothetical protein
VDQSSGTPVVIGKPSELVGVDPAEVPGSLMAVYGRYDTGDSTPGDEVRLTADGDTHGQIEMVNLGQNTGPFYFVLEEDADLKVDNQAWSTDDTRVVVLFLEFIRGDGMHASSPFQTP